MGYTVLLVGAVVLGLWSVTALLMIILVAAIALGIYNNKD
jgi:hypothetical protein